MRNASRLLLLLVLLCPLAACDGWRAERAASYKCEKGLALLKDCETRWTKGDLSTEERQDVITQLTRSVKLLRDGMALFAEASEKTGKHYDMSAYWEALKVARIRMMLELRD